MREHPLPGARVYVRMSWSRSTKACAQCLREIPTGGKYYVTHVQPSDARPTVFSTSHYLCPDCAPIPPEQEIPPPWHGKELGIHWRGDYDVPAVPLRYALLKAMSGNSLHVVEATSPVRVQIQHRPLCAPVVLGGTSNYAIPPTDPDSEARWISSQEISAQSIAEAPPGINVLEIHQTRQRVCAGCRRAYEELVDSWSLL